MNSSVAAPRSSTIGALPATGAVAAAKRYLTKAAGNGLLVGAAVCVLASVWILAGLGGFEYYRTPLSVRAYEPAHRLLRPSGPAGQMFGVVGTLLMLVPFAYVARKHVKAMKNAGSVKAWLEVHLFCGIVGPVLVTYHTSFKFNGLVSAAYWSMVLVVLSGFVGRFLYVRIPRSIRGVELTRGEVDTRAEELRGELQRSIAGAGSEELVRTIETFERAAQPEQPSTHDLIFGELVIARRVRRLERSLASLPSALRQRAVALAVERSLLLHRVAYLQRTKKMFELWHVFHMPFVLILLVIAAAHISLVLYMGYVPFRW